MAWKAALRRWISAVALPPAGLRSEGVFAARRSGQVSRPFLVHPLRCDLHHTLGAPLYTAARLTTVDQSLEPQMDFPRSRARVFGLLGAALMACGVSSHLRLW